MMNSDISWVNVDVAPSDYLSCTSQFLSVLNKGCVYYKLFSCFQGYLQDLVISFRESGIRKLCPLASTGKYI